MATPAQRYRAREQLSRQVYFAGIGIPVDAVD